VFICGSFLFPFSRTHTSDRPARLPPQAPRGSPDPPHMQHPSPSPTSISPLPPGSPPVRDWRRPRNHHHIPSLSPQTPQGIARAPSPATSLSITFHLSCIRVDSWTASPPPCLPATNENTTSKPGSPPPASQTPNRSKNIRVFVPIRGRPARHPAPPGKTHSPKQKTASLFRDAVRAPKKASQKETPYTSLSSAHLLSKHGGHNRFQLNRTGLTP